MVGREQEHQGRRDSSREEYPQNTVAGNDVEIPEHKRFTDESFGQGIPGFRGVFDGNHLSHHKRRGSDLHLLVFDVAQNSRFNTGVFLDGVDNILNAFAARILLIRLDVRQLIGEHLQKAGAFSQFFRGGVCSIIEAKPNDKLREGDVFHFFPYKD